MSDAIEKLANVLAQNVYGPPHVRAKAILAAIRADVTAFVPVKQLRWYGVTSTVGQHYRAKTPLGLFEVKGRTGFYAEHNQKIISDVLATLELAQAAAQTHFENQWKECIA